MVLIIGLTRPISTEFLTEKNIPAKSSLQVNFEFHQSNYLKEVTLIICTQKPESSGDYKLLDILI